MSALLQSPNEMDRLFSRYLKAQVPLHWPPAPTPPSAEVSEVRQVARPTGLRSRLTLAAAVVILLGLGLFLSNGPRTPPGLTGDQPATPGLLKSAIADGKGLNPKATLPTTKASDR